MKSINLLKILSNQRWGADRASLLKIYRATTRSQLDYGCQVYGSAPPRFIKRLDAIHHLGLRLCTGAFKSSPILSLMADTGEMKLEERRKQLMLQLYCRQQQLTNNPSVDFYGVNYQQNAHSKPFGASVHDLALQLQLQIPAIILYKQPELPPWRLPADLTCTFHLPMSKKTYPDYVIKRFFQEHENQKHNGFSFLFNMRWATTFWSEVYPTRVSSIVLQDFF